MLQSGADQLGVTILTEDETPETIISLTEDLKNRDFEIIGGWDMDVFFQKNYFVRFGSGYDF